MHGAVREIAFCTMVQSGRCWPVGSAMNAY